MRSRLKTVNWKKLLGITIDDLKFEDHMNMQSAKISALSIYGLAEKKANNECIR